MIQAHTLLTAVAFTFGTISTTVLAAPLPIGAGLAMGGTTTIVGGADLTVPTFEEAPGARSPPFPDRGDVDAGLLEVEDKPFGVDFREDYCPPPHPDLHSDAYDDNEKTKVVIVIEDDLPRIPVQDGMPTQLHPVKAVPVPKPDLVGDEYDEEEMSISPLRSHSGPEFIERRSPKPVDAGSDYPGTIDTGSNSPQLPPLDLGPPLTGSSFTGPSTYGDTPPPSPGLTHVTTGDSLATGMATRPLLPTSSAQSSGSRRQKFKDTISRHYQNFKASSNGQKMMNVLNKAKTKWGQSTQLSQANPVA